MVRQCSIFCKYALPVILLLAPVTEVNAQPPAGSPPIAIGVFAGLRLVKFNPPLVDHVNEFLPLNNGDAAPNELPTAGATTLFEKNQAYYLFAFSTPPAAKAVGKLWYEDHVVVRIGGLEFEPASNFPHLFSYLTNPATKEIVDTDMDGVPDFIRGYVGYIPAELVPPGVHDVRILVDGVPLFIAIEGSTFASREFFGHNPDGTRVVSVSPGPEEGMLSLNVVDVELPFNINIHTSQELGNPLDLSAVAVNADGSTTPLAQVGSGGIDWPLFQEYTFAVLGADPGSSNHLEVRISGYNSGAGAFTIQGAGFAASMPGALKLIVIP